MKNIARTRYTFRSFHRADDVAGLIDVTTTETLVETPDGLRVESHAVGVAEGSRVDESSSKVWPGATLAAAIAYRDARPESYTRVSPRE